MVNDAGDGNAKVKESVLDGVRNYLPPFPLDIEAAIGKIEANWSQEKSRSTQNWRLLHVPLKKKSGYKDLDWRESEVLLERMICDEGQRKDVSIWNQMPAASGLLPLPAKRDDGKRRVSAEGRRAIDLVFRHKGTDSIYEFLELKIRRKDGSVDSLRHAALEVLEYGLLYLFSRKNQKILEYESSTDQLRYAVLGASEIRLRVLAAANYYASQDCSEIPVTEINKALEAYICKHFGNFRMNFGFQVLKEEAATPFEAFDGREDLPLGEAKT